MHSYKYTYVSNNIRPPGKAKENLIPRFERGIFLTWDLRESNCRYCVDETPSKLANPSLGRFL